VQFDRPVTERSKSLIRLSIALGSGSIFFARLDCPFYSLINAPDVFARPVLSRFLLDCFVKDPTEAVRLSGQTIQNKMISYFVRFCQGLSTVVNGD
jgi:hypothetical protein